MGIRRNHRYLSGGEVWKNQAAMLDVFLTVDVETWCDDWDDIDQQFPDAFRRHIYGPTARGDFGLPYQLSGLRDAGLMGVFFVEPLFATRFGSDYLQEIAGLIQEANQEIQLHLHTEWVDESRVPLIADAARKRQHIRYFTLQEQITLIAAGAQLLNAASSTPVCAFRAGSCALNRDTLRALKANQFPIDCSYNASQFGLDSGVSPGSPALDVFECEGIVEYPVTVFQNGMTSLRHAALTACSYAEMEFLLWQALEARYQSFVILSHSFELLNPAKTRPDPVMVDRFRKLCGFLDRNRDSFNVRGFHGLEMPAAPSTPRPLASPIGKTAARMLEQLSRLRYR